MSAAYSLDIPAPPLLPGDDGTCWNMPELGSVGISRRPEYPRRSPIQLVLASLFLVFHFVRVGAHRGA